MAFSLLTSLIIGSLFALVWVPSFMVRRLLVLCLLLFSGCVNKDHPKLAWPQISRESKPWTRWWWEGSAVTKEGITRELMALKKAGIGGVEITPIYGVFGFEEQFIPYLSPRWMEMLEYTLSEAERLDLGVDMATGTGWPFGGPWVSGDDACKNLNYQVYELNEGGSLPDPILFHQLPMVRSIGMRIDQPSGNRKQEKVLPSQISEPVESNKNLQQLALEQVRYDKWLVPSAIVAYSSEGEVVDVTNRLDAEGRLLWVAPKGSWKIYALYLGWHGKMVERAAPGGEGNVIDHFSANAVRNYLHVFDTALQHTDIKTLRAYFNDSYEVDDAVGSADWTDDFFDQFQLRRGYDLRHHLPEFLSNDSTEMAVRILCDYRETVSDLVRDNFTSVWKDWAHKSGHLVRNQAHGSPSNILDLYATVDIPETEGTEPLRIKMATSAGNVTGKRLISSESATWLNEHFQSNLGDIKGSLDRYFVNGVNHVFYHGTCYSPETEPWPGWLFYAAVHMNDRNPLWQHVDALNEYATRCQSILQTSSPTNDVLIYYPVYDKFSERSSERLEHFDGIEKQFEGTAFKDAAEHLLARGFSFDYISDRQLTESKVSQDRLITSGGSRYKAIVVPHCMFMPVESLEALSRMMAEGMPVIFYKGYPSTFSGYARFADKQDAWDEIRNVIKKNSNGLVTDALEETLSGFGVEREVMADQGLWYIRKSNSLGMVYFIVNASDETFSDWVELQAKGDRAGILDPMSGRLGQAKTKQTSGKEEIFLVLQPGESVFVQLSEDPVQMEEYSYFISGEKREAIDSKWMVAFDSGDTLPSTSLASWDLLAESKFVNYSGTAVYSSDIPKPVFNCDNGVFLDVGKVGETARVKINGQVVGTYLGPIYTAFIPDSLIKEMNHVEIEVASTMANRISAMDRERFLWKKFYNVNFPAKLSENSRKGILDASRWKPRPSGLMGPVQWIAVE